MAYTHRPRAAVLLFWAVLAALILLFSGCDSPAPVDEVPPEEPLKTLWYVFAPRGGSFLDFAALEDSLPTPPELMLPWVNQVRVTEFYLHNGSLLLGINGFGLGAVGFDPEPDLELFPDSVRFAGRTLGGLFGSAKGVMVHLYEDMVFSSPSPGPAVPLHLFNPGERRFSSLSTGRDFWSQGWILVDLLPREGGFLEQWKREEEGEVFFSYVLREEGSGGTAVRELSQEEFRRLYRPVTLEKAAAEVREAWELIGWEDDGKIMQDLVFPRGSVLPGEVRTQSVDPDQVEGYERIPAFFDNRGLTVLDGPRNRLISSHGAERTVPLPLPPPGCVYTSLAGSAEWWILGWEESLFPLVGRAGLVFLPR